MELHICLMLGKKMPTTRRLRELTNADIESLKEENIMKDVLKVENTFAKCKQNNAHLNSQNKKLTSEVERLNKKMST